jgi:hypothetical protein
MIPLAIMGLILVAGLVMLWRGSLRRNLSDSDLDAYLEPAAGDRDTYHAAEELSRRITRKDPERKRFYPKLIAIAASPHPEKRKAAAWVMGEDAAEPTFEEPLARLVADPVPIVRHNAALSLARRGSDLARPVLISMLQQSKATAPADGTFHPKVKVGESADLVLPLATITTPSGEVAVDAPVPGKVLAITEEGAKVAKGDPIATFAPVEVIALQALRALTLPAIGRPEDAEVIEAFLKSSPDLDAIVQDQAKEALLAVRQKAESR